MDVGIIIGIYGIFFLFAIVAFLKHILTNSSSLTRFLRSYVMMVAFVFIAYSIISFVFLVKKQQNNYSLNIIVVITYVVFTLLVIGHLIKIDNVKPKSRDEWKYSALIFENFITKNSPKPKHRIYDFFIASIKLLFVFLTIGLFIVSIAISPKEFFTSILSSLMIFIVLCFLAWNIQSVNELFKENNRYNFLKRKLIGGEILNICLKTKKEIGRKLLELYDLLFIQSLFYKKNCNTNDAILKEIGAKCELDLPEYWHLLSENRKKSCL